MSPYKAVYGHNIKTPIERVVAKTQSMKEANNKETSTSLHPNDSILIRNFRSGKGDPIFDSPATVV